MGEEHSMDEAEAAEIARLTAYDSDHFETFEEGAEAIDWASQAAEAAGMPFMVAWREEPGEFRAGPVVEADLITSGLAGVSAVVAAFDADGAPAAIEPEMFPESSEDAEYLNRLSKVALQEHLARLAPAPEARKARGDLARSRRASLGAVDIYNADFALLGERVIKRHSVYDRRNALRKKKTVMDKDRRRVARNAKLWRLRNKSKAKRYGSLYHGPKTKVKEAAVDTGPEWRDLVISEAGEVVREATEAEVAAAIAQGGPLIVERRRVRA